MTKRSIFLAAAFGIVGCNKAKEHAHGGDHAHDGGHAHGDHARDGDHVHAGTSKQPRKPDAEEGRAPTDANGVAEAIMTAYERCRVKLAADDANTAKCAGDIAFEARRGKARLGAAGALAEAIATAADAMVKTEGIGKIRIALGEVSRPVEKLLIAMPEVAAKYRMYECPMAEGFNRWAELSSGAKHTMANPYMGTAMLQCGSEVHDHHKGGVKKHDHDGKADHKHRDKSHKSGHKH